MIGIGLIFFAVFQYRNKSFTYSLTISILLGLVFTFVPMYFLDQETKYGTMAGRTFQRFALNDLDSLKKQLEGYKQDYGEYPDSLEELKKKFKEVAINDPLLLRNKKAHKFLKFYYFRKDSSYTLFSSGIDCIPYTEDDLYPRKPLK